MIRQSMKRQLEDKMLHTFTLAKNDIHWMNGRKEILINGRMFDIKSFQPACDGKFIFTGLFDDEETALVNTIRKGKENDKDGKLLTQLIQLLQSSFNNIPTGVICPSFNKNYYLCVKQPLAFQFLTILSPPPQV